MSLQPKAMAMLSRILSFVAAACLAIALFVPLWRIDLDAPQYPEGLRLLIHPHKLGGNVDIINGLNHYIGMQTLHTENFIEFRILPFIIGAFAVLFLLVAVIAKRGLLHAAFIAFVLFGIVAMIDFWRWEYNYGHELDPNAAIKVPGMAYQPPLIGFKQLLNFGAYSMPDVGGWLFIAAGLLIFLAVVLEYRSAKRWRVNGKAVIIAFALLGFIGCSNAQPESIRLNSEACAHCKMTISDLRFAAQLQTQKGRIYSFDDLRCLVEYQREQSAATTSRCWVWTMNAVPVAVNVEDAFFIRSEKFQTPMRGGVAALQQHDDAKRLAAENNTSVLRWNDIEKIKW